MNDTTIMVKNATKKRLERLKKGEFKRKYKTKSINDVIKKLLDIHDEYVILKERMKGIVETGEIAEETLRSDFPKSKEEWKKKIKEQSETEEEDVCPDCVRFSSCTRDWIRDGEQVKIHGCFVPRNQCVFRTLSNDKKVDCAKDYARTGRIHKVTLEFCENCWKRKQAMMNKMRKSQDISQRPISIPCSIEGTFKIEKPSDLLKLPCIDNPSLKCKNTKCNEEVLRLMKQMERPKND